MVGKHIARALTSEHEPNGLHRLDNAMRLRKLGPPHFDLFPLLGFYEASNFLFYGPEPQQQPPSQLVEHISDIPDDLHIMMSNVPSWFASH